MGRMLGRMQNARMYFTSNDGSQSSLKLTLDKLELEKDKGTDYVVLSWKSKHSVSLGTDPPASKPQPSNFFCARRHLES